MVAEQAGDFVEQTNESSLHVAVQGPQSESGHNQGGALDALDIAELTGLPEKRVRAVIKQLLRDREISERDGVTRKRPDGRKTTHWREPGLPKILDGAVLLVAEEGDQD